MLIESSNILSTLTAIVVSFLGVFLWKRLHSPLNQFSGPFLAKFSDVWRLIDVWRGSSDVTQRSLHKKYGSAVRIGPNCISVSDPAMIKTIYSTKTPFNKSEFYSAGDTLSQGKKIQTQFTTRNEQWHDYVVRPIRGAYSLTNILRFESLLDSTLDYFVEKLKRQYCTSNNSTLQGACPIGELLHHFAWDVIGEVTFRRRLGALDGDQEILQLLKDGEKAIDYLAVIGQMPFLDTLLKNRYFSIGPPGFKVAADFSAARLAARIQGQEKTMSTDQDDFIDVFIEAEKSEEGEGQMTRRQISWMVINMVAGSDTTAACLRAVLYYVARDERIRKKLTDELIKAAGNTRRHLDWKTCHCLPYLDAVIKETLRISPSVGLLLERVVPSGGLYLSDGRFIPEGTIVGINPRVVSHDRHAFGENTHEFVPERWLRSNDESESEYESRLSKMKDADLTFGFGKRMCIGRNLAILECYKCVARLFLEFEVSLLSIPFSSIHYIDLLIATLDNSWECSKGMARCERLVREAIWRRCLLERACLSLVLSFSLRLNNRLELIVSSPDIDNFQWRADTH